MIRFSPAFLISGLKAKLGSHQMLAGYSASLMLYAFSNFVMNIAAMHWIGPADLGVWRSLALIQTYSPLLLAGIIHGMSREFPYNLGRGNPEIAHRQVACAAAISLSGAGLVLMGCLATAAAMTSSSMELRFSLVGLAICVSTQFYRLFLQATFRTNQAFIKLTRLYIIESTLNIVSLVLVIKWGYYGYVVKLASVEIIMTILSHYHRPVKVKPQFLWEEVPNLIKVGIPIFLFGYVNSIIATFPRMLMLLKNGTSTVGLYTPAESVLVMIMLLPNSVSQYIYPKMTYQYGKTSNPSQLWNMAWKSIVALFIVNLGIALGGWLLLPTIIKLYFAKYLNSIPAILISLTGGIFLCINIGTVLMNTLKSWSWRLILIGVNCTLGLGLPLLLTIWYPPLVGIPLGTAISNMVVFFVGFYGIWRLTRADSGLKLVPVNGEV